MATNRNLKLGRFVIDEDGNLHGNIGGLGLGVIDVVTEEAKSQDGKTYMKLIADPLRAPYEIGAAFPKKKDGLDYFSVSLESPLLPAPISAALFPERGNEGAFNLVWSRPEAPKPAAEVTVTTGQGQRHKTKGITP